MSNPTQLRVVIVSPERTLYDAEVESLLVPGTQGQFEVLKNHASIISTLEQGEIICNGDSFFTIFTTGGFIEVQDNIATLCIETQ